MNPAIRHRGTMNNGQFDDLVETLGREAFAQVQLRKFQLMLEPVIASNAFYRGKLGGAGIATAGRSQPRTSVRSVHHQGRAVRRSAGQPSRRGQPDFPRERYVRIHQTSGTTGSRSAASTRSSHGTGGRGAGARCTGPRGSRPADRILFAFSFGPFIGFWSGYEGAQLIGALAIPGGGMSSSQRLRAIVVNDITVLVCTPTYALHLAEVADEEGVDLAARASTSPSRPVSREPACPPPRSGSRMPGGPGASTMPGRLRWGRGDSSARRRRAFTSTRASSSPR